MKCFSSPSFKMRSEKGESHSTEKDVSCEALEAPRGQMSSGEGTRLLGTALAGGGAGM